MKTETKLGIIEIVANVSVSIVMLLAIITTLMYASIVFTYPINCEQDIIAIILLISITFINIKSQA